MTHVPEVTQTVHWLEKKKKANTQVYKKVLHWHKAVGHISYKIIYTYQIYPCTKRSIKGVTQLI